MYGLNVTIKRKFPIYCFINSYGKTTLAYVILLHRKTFVIKLIQLLLAFQGIVQLCYIICNLLFKTFFISFYGDVTH